MDISVLEEFVSLAETCSFQETAAVMNVSQSALTKHIHKLEEELNLSLFDRSTRNVRLNEYSRAFYPYARQICMMHHDALAELSEMKNKDSNSFTIAYAPVLGQYGIVDTISDYAGQNPENTFHTVESYQAMTLLQSKKCDFAFVSERDVTDDNYNKIIYKTDHLTAVVPDGHPLAGQDFVALEQLYNERFILHSSHNDIPHEETAKFLDLCASRGFQAQIAAESQFTSTMLRYVSAGRGIAILNRFHIPGEIPGISVIDFKPTIRSYIYLLYPRRFSSPCAAHFLHYMIESIGARDAASGSKTT